MSLSYLPGTASLLEELDKKLMVLLRDGRTLIGYLRSVDQFANLVLHQTIERIHVEQSYGDIPRGVFVVRGENVVLLGEIDQEKTEPGALGLVEVSLEEILEKQAMQQQEKEETDRIRAKAFKERGLTYSAEATYEDMY
jgi:U6 snRNA-associated Sm-like protein LSm1